MPPNQTEVDRLIDELTTSADNPAQQSKLIRQLVKLGDPKVIVELAALYEKENTDPGVRAEAKRGLRAFRAIETRLTGGGRSSPISAELLSKLRIGLAGLLVLTLVINGILFVVHSQPPPATPAQSVATARDTLTGLIKTRLEGLRGDATSLRLRWQEAQAHVKLTCPVTFSGIGKVATSPIDLTTYPDLPAIDTDLNKAADAIGSLRDRWTSICAKPEDTANVAQFTGEGGAQARIVEVDSAMKLLGSAQNEFTDWTNIPAPTNGPTATVTSRPMTATLTPTITLTPTTGPTKTPSLTPTIATPTVTPIQSLKFSGVQLNTLKTYEYTLNISYGGGSKTGTLTLDVSRTAALTGAGAFANYKIGDVDDSKLFAPLNPFFVKGIATYVVVGGASYAIGGASGSGCRAGAPTLSAALNTLNPDTLLRLPDTPLTRVLPDIIVDRLAVEHYHTDSTTGADANKVMSAYDLYVTPGTHQPISVVIAITGPGAGTGIIAANKDITKFTMQYDLVLVNPKLDAVVPQICH